MVNIVLVALLVSVVVCQDIKLERMDPSTIKTRSIDPSLLQGKLNLGGIQDVIMKVHFREKHLKKKSIEEISSDLEEVLSDADLEY